MKLKILTLALAATALGSLSAAAQTTIIEDRRAPVVIERRGPPPVVVERRAAPPVVVETPAPSVDVQTSQPILGGVQTTTSHTESIGAGVDCTTRTVQNNTLLGSNSVTTRGCD
jgi:hypothetical protein